MVRSGVSQLGKLGLAWPQRDAAASGRHRTLGAVSQGCSECRWRASKFRTCCTWMHAGSRQQQGARAQAGAVSSFLLLHLSIFCLCLPV